MSFMLLKCSFFIISFWSADNSNIKTFKVMNVQTSTKTNGKRDGKYGVSLLSLFYRFSWTCSDYGFILLCSFCARVCFRREGKERRKERCGDVPREMERTDAPGTVISPGEENGERDPWHVKRSKKGERKLDICSMPWYAAQLILGIPMQGKNYRTVFNCNWKNEEYKR